MKDINLMPANDLNKLEFNIFLKKVIVILTITFFILILFVIIISITKRYLINKLQYTDNQLNDLKYNQSELIKNELDELLTLRFDSLQVFEELEIDYKLDAKYIEFVCNNLNSTTYLNDIFVDNYNNKMIVKGVTDTPESLVLLIAFISDKQIFDSIDINELKKDINEQVVFSLEFSLFG